jgi:spoIIIJ-associated protein
MEHIKDDIQKIFTLLGVRDIEATIDEEHKKISLITDDHVISSNLATILPAVEHLFALVLKKRDLPLFIIDINFYRKERERIIAELARAAAKKAMITKTNIELPPMNSYERRLVHSEITLHPELTTESAGIGKERHVIIKKITP